MWYQWVAGAITSGGLAGCVSFVLVYHHRSGGTWHDTSEGRYLVATKTILASLFALILSYQIFGDWPGRQFVAITLYTLYAAFPWWLFYLLIRATRQTKGG
jgi:hypothetical protein